MRVNVHKSRYSSTAVVVYHTAVADSGGAVTQSVSCVAVPAMAQHACERQPMLNLFGYQYVMRQR